jgi:uncharacterized membrane protein YbhN (UPF0104 family)
MTGKELTRRGLFLSLQLAVTAAALYYIFHDAARRAQMLAALRQADWRWLALGIGAYGGLELMAVLRWRILLRIQGFELPWLQAAAILFISEFFTVCTPGLVGGDAMRILYLARIAPAKKMDAALTVLMDRLAGLISLIALAAGVLTLRYDWLSRSATVIRLVHAMMALLGVSALLLLVAIVAARRREALAGWLPPSVGQVLTALQRYGTNWQSSLAALGMTLIAHGCYYVTFCCAAHALTRGGPPSFGAVFSVMPIVNTLVALPISLGGIGLRESLFQVLLHNLAGTPEAVGALIGTVGFSIQALWAAVPGGAAFVCYRWLSATPVHGGETYAEAVEDESQPSAEGT